MRHAPSPDENGMRWYGPPYEKRREDKAKCIAQVFGFHTSHQCVNARKEGTEFCGVHAEAPAERIKMFFVGYWHDCRAKSRGGIYTVEVAKVSESRVQLPNGRWDKRASRSGRYFDTEAEAVAHVRDGLVRSCEYTERAIIDARKELDDFDKLYPRVK